MGLWGFGKKVISDAIGKSYLMPLDTLVSAKLLCRGFTGNTFTITHTSGAYPPVLLQLTNNDLTIGQYKAVLVPLPLGAYTVKVDVGGTIVNATANLATMGTLYTLSYSSYEVIGTFYSNSTFTVPAGVTTIYVTAVGGGGGGGYGGGTGDDANGGGGGGGGAGSYILQKAYTVTAGSSIAITVGKGGAPYTSGTSTVVGGLVTLSGGAAGSNGQSGGSSYENRCQGGAGGGVGGRGGDGGLESYGTGSSGSSGGTGGGSGGAGSRGGGGGGGAGGISLTGAIGGGGYGGAGGNGDRYTPAESGRDGTYPGAGGGGGGGAGYRYQVSGSGGKGADGFVRISKGIVVS